MELENIKDLWQKNHEETPEISLEKQKEIRMPLEMIRSNLKGLFYRTAFAFITSIMGIFILAEGATRIATAKWTALAIIFIFIIIYYYTKLFKLYKSLSNNENLTKKFLLDLKYDINLSIESLKSYYLTTIPLIFGELLIIWPDSAFEDHSKLIKLSIVILIATAMLIYRQKVYLKNNFVKPLSMLQDIINDL